ncbi:fimbrial usher protein StbD [Vibrio jasicida]|uniref:fimbrial usher protein StbD n=1 Tax=Vibrio jasicida TaxID=766224 RepID=UPI0005EDE8DA|nr:fimbrial usher protein StbD [Vibrio jasicida]
MKYSIWSLCLFIWFVNMSAFATCTKLNTTNQGSLSTEAINAGYYVNNNFTGAADGYFGNYGLPSVININSGSFFQPDGSVIATSTASFLGSASRTPYGVKQVLFRCDLTDKNDLWEYYSTNGDDNYAGRNEVPGIPGAYYSDYHYAAFRLTNLATGEYYSRNWKARKLNPDDMFQDSNYIYVHAGVFSDVSVEVIKVTSGTGNLGFSYGRYSPTYNAVQGYIAFKGGGRSSGLTVGCDHGNGCFSGWYGDYPGAWGWANQLTFIRGAFCRTSDYTPHVLFPTMTIDALNSGESSRVTFSIGLLCELNAASGTTSNTSASLTATRPIAIGLLVNSANAVSKAEQLGLKTSTGGLTYLLSNEYGNPGVAQGVGIRIYDNSGSPMNLLPSRTTGTGNAGGWYGFKEVTQLESSNASSESYRGHFTASLEKLNGETITAGVVYAQVQIIVSFQ